MLHFIVLNHGRYILDIFLRVHKHLVKENVPLKTLVVELVNVRQDEPLYDLFCKILNTSIHLKGQIP